jgi:hypothetical protein
MPEMASDFLFEVCEWFGILLNCFVNVVSESCPMADPSFMSELFARSLKHGQDCEFFIDDPPDTSLDEELQSSCFSAEVLLHRLRSL